MSAWPRRFGCKPVTGLDDPAGLRGWACVCGSADEPHPWGKGPHSDASPCHSLARYDTDWAATGPLIERLGITLVLVSHDGPPRGEVLAKPYWWAEVGHLDWYDGPICDDREDGPTPLLAVCALILALAEAGKLPRG